MTLRERIAYEAVHAKDNFKLRSIVFSIVNTLKADSYLIDLKDGVVTIVAGDERGQLYGLFDLIRSLRIAGGTMSLHREGTPDFELRMLWSWGRITDSYRHSPYMDYLSLINDKTMSDPESYPELIRFFRHCATMGVNALTITYELHTKDLEHEDQHLYRPYYKIINAFAEYLKSWGIDLYILASSAPEPDWQKTVADTVCPYDPRVVKFTRDFIDEYCHEMPEIAGLFVGSGFGSYDGKMVNCRCEFCGGGKSANERLLEQLNLFAGALVKHKKKMVYTITTDIGPLVSDECEAGLAIRHSIPDNVYVSYKNCYHDYEDLRYPEHPLTANLSDIGPKEGGLRFAVEYQLFPEMRGKGTIISNVAERWCREIREDKRLGIRGSIGVIETHPDDAHPSMADWYVWGRMLWEDRTADELLAEWASLEYPVDAGEVVVSILKDSFKAAGNVCYAGGCQCGIHGTVVPFPHYAIHIINDTWYKRDQPLPKGFVGSADEALGAFPKKRQKEILDDPHMVLFTGNRKVTPELKKLLDEEKSEAVRLFQKMFNSWQDVKSVFNEGDYRYNEMEQMLKNNIGDARRFRENLRLLLCWQDGSLTLGEIEDSCRNFVGTGEHCSLNTCDEVFDKMLTNLTHEVEGREYDRTFDFIGGLPQLHGLTWQVGDMAGEPPVEIDPSKRGFFKWSTI